MTEHAQARAWRESLGLSAPQLGALLGYSAESIYAFERGHNGAKQPTPPLAFRRYKLACLGLRTMTAYGATLDKWTWT